jgi:hypothetical protein
LCVWPAGIRIKTNLQRRCCLVAVGADGVVSERRSSRRAQNLAPQYALRISNLLPADSNIRAGVSGRSRVGG